MRAAVGVEANPWTGGKVALAHKEFSNTAEVSRKVREDSILREILSRGLPSVCCYRYFPSDVGSRCQTQITLRLTSWAPSTPTWPPASTTWRCSTRNSGPIREGRAPLRAVAGDPGKGPGPGAPKRGDMLGELRAPATKHEPSRKQHRWKLARWQFGLRAPDYKSRCRTWEITARTCSVLRTCTSSALFNWIQQMRKFPILRVFTKIRSHCRRGA